MVWSVFNLIPLPLCVLNLLSLVTSVVSLHFSEIQDRLSSTLLPNLRTGLVFCHATL